MIVEGGKEGRERERERERERGREIESRERYKVTINICVQNIIKIVFYSDRMAFLHTQLLRHL